MATKTSDYVVTSDMFTEGRTIDANKKTALRLNIDGFTKSDVSSLKMKINESGNLVITHSGKSIEVKNYSSIKYIKTDYVKKGKKEYYNLTNIIDSNLVDNTTNPITKIVTNSKKKTATLNGTVYNDEISASAYEGSYKLYINTNSGNDSITGSNKIDIIKAGNGNDTIYGQDGNDTIYGENGNDSITGGKGNDIIAGGTGTNTIIYNSGDGSDTVYLTKGENLKIDMQTFAKDDLGFKVSGKDLIIYDKTNSDATCMTIKNFALQDVTNNANSKKKIANTSSVELLLNNSEKIDLRNDLYLDTVKADNNYTGNWHDETITAESYQLYYRNKKKEITGENNVVTSKGLTLNGAGGEDSITGSKYSDTIIGGSGNDTIIGGTGNDYINGGSGNDSLTGGTGNDTITGGTGSNTIHYEDSEFGIDTINLTKGETLNINFDDTTNMFYQVNPLNKNDIAITNGEDFKNGTVILKNYATKNTGASVLVNGHDLVTENLLEKVDTTNYFTKSKTKYTGTMLADSIDASELDGLTKTVKQGKKKVTVAKEITDRGVEINSGNGNDKVYGSKYSDIIKTGSGNDEVHAGTGNDYIDGSSGNDTIYAQDGNDTINGGSGNDSITGGVGNDKITGGTGTNTIIYKSGDGSDTVYLTKGENLKIDMQTFASEDLGFKVSGKDLLIYDKTNNDATCMTIKNFATIDVTNNANLKKKIANTSSVELLLNNSEKIDLRNDLYLDTVKTDKNYTGNWHDETITAESYQLYYRNKKKQITGENNVVTSKGLTLNGAGGEDNITGTKYSDTIKGGSGNDTITGFTGNDKLYGETGSNTFIFNNGDGNDIVYSGKGSDTLKFADSKFNDLVFERGTGKNNKNLIIKYNVKTVDDVTTYDSVTISNYYKVDKKGRIVGVNSSVKEIITKSGTCTLTEAIKYRTKYPDSEIIVGHGQLLPESNTKVMIGSDTNDNIAISGKVETIIAGAGNDTIYSYSNTTEFVTIDGGAGNDDISAYSLTSNNTIYGGAGNDTIAGSTEIGDLIYGDYDLTIDATQSQGDNDLIRGMKGSDTIYGGGGDDSLHGYLNNGTVAHDVTEGITDELHGGAGNDELYAESKNNILYGDEGDDKFYLQYGTSDIHGGTGNNLYIARYVTENSQEHEHASIHTINTDTNSENNDKLYFEKNTSLVELKLHRNGNDLRILYTDNKEVVVKDYFVNNTSCISEIYVNGAYNYDGSVKDASKISTIENLITNGTLIWDEVPSSGNLTEYKDEITINTATTINALGGNDKITLGKDLSITVDGGDGNDTIYGSNNSTGSGSTYIGGNGQDSIYGKLGNDTIYGGSNSELTDTSDNYLEGGAGNDIIYGGAGADTIYTGSNGGAIDTTSYEDTVYAGDGEDIIYAQSKKSTIYAGKGNDIINGNTETEEYIVYNKGDGIDTISTGTGSLDTIKINGYSLENLYVSQDGNDMIIAGDLGDKIILTNAVTTDVNTKIIIGDTTYSLLDSRLYKYELNNQNNFTGTRFSDNITGSDEADNLSGGGANDTLSGGNGADTLTGGDGNDLLIGGIGNDSLVGGAGNNTYQFATGDGIDTIISATGSNDTIKFTNIAVSSLEKSNFVKVDNNLEITYGSDKIILEDYFTKLPTITLADSGNTIYLQDKLTEFGITFAPSGNSEVSGTTGNDIIIGSDGNNTITGGEGDDTMNGGIGDDTYVFNNGDGKDIVIDTNATTADKLQFKDVTFDSLKFEESSDDLIIKYNITAEDAYDSVTIKDYFTETNTIKTIVDSTNTEFDIADKNTHTINMTTTNCTGTRLNDIITGTTGNDTILGTKGNDTIDGGSGNNTFIFNNGDGEDTIILTNAGSSDNNILTFPDVDSIWNISMTKVDNDLVLKYTDNDKVTLKDYFISENASKYNTIKLGDIHYLISGFFTNQIKVDKESVTEGQTLTGLTDFQNNILASNYTDTITGGKLRDTIYTYDGNDTVHTGAG